MRKFIKFLKIPMAIVTAVLIAVTIPIITICFQFYQPPQIPEIYNKYLKMECDASVFINPDIKNPEIEIWVNNTLELVPQNCIDALSQNWSIIIAPLQREFQNADAIQFTESDVIQDKYTNVDISIGGYTSISDKIIYICENTCYNKELFEVTLIHEIGHMISAQHGILDNQEDWLMIFDKNHNQYTPNHKYNFPEYSNRNSAEMFATAFCDFILESEKLKENNNDMYSYMQKIQNLNSKISIFSKLSNAYHIIQYILIQNFNHGGT